MQNHSSALTLRLLGHIILCGALHVVWQSKGGVHGEYMAFILFRSCLILAVPQANTHFFNVVACIEMKTLRLEQADNGKGTQDDTKKAVVTDYS